MLYRTCLLNIDMVDCVLLNNLSSLQYLLCLTSSAPPLELKGYVANCCYTTGGQGRGFVANS